MRIKGQTFVNTSTCHGMAFATNAPLDLAEIVINGRYPQNGWARNLESHEMVRVLSGKGIVIFKQGDEIILTEGDVVHVPPGTWFAWDGKMTVLISCGPAFHRKQYEVEEVNDEV